MMILVLLKIWQKSLFVLIVGGGLKTALKAGMHFQLKETQPRQTPRMSKSAKICFMEGPEEMAFCGNQDYR